jgi:hypothetical protein
MPLRLPADPPVRFYRKLRPMHADLTQRPPAGVCEAIPDGFVLRYNPRDEPRLPVVFEFRGRHGAHSFGACRVTSSTPALAWERQRGKRGS